jgi:hypothetical protein
MKVAIVGPNFNSSEETPFRVHIVGCADIARDARKCGDLYPLVTEVASKREAVSRVYGPEAGSFYQEAGGDARHPGGLNQYLDQYIDSELSFAPCVKGLPRSQP